MTRRLEGRPLADRLRRETRPRGGADLPRLLLVRVGEDAAAATFAEGIAREARVWEVACRSVVLAPARPAPLARALGTALRSHAAGGVLLVPPFPSGVDTARLRCALPVQADVGVDHPTTRDAVLAKTTRLLPPTAAATLLLLEEAGALEPSRRVRLLGGRGFAALALAAALAAEGLAVELAPPAAADAPPAPDAVASLGLAPAVLGRPSVREGGVVVDLGVHVGPTGALVGDADVGALEGWAGAVASGPSGAGPLLAAVVLRHHVWLSAGKAPGKEDLPLFA